MSAARKAMIRQLAASAYEMDLGVSQGILHRDAASGEWKVGDRSLDRWLESYAGKDVVLIAACLEDERPLETQVCRTCGTEYVGSQCPRCREVRRRLRGR